VKTRHLLMLAGFFIAASLLFFGDNSPDTAPDGELAKPIARAPGLPASAGSDSPVGERAGTAFNGTASGVTQKKSELHILALHSRPDLIAGSRIGQGGDGLFSSKSWVPPPVKAKPGPPPAPVAPPLPFTYLGKQAAGGHLEVYLAQGDRVIVAREQMLIDGTYRVESIKPPTLSLTYLPLKQIQQISIGVTD